MAPVNPRPRSYAEHPSGPLAPKPANDNVLGHWENGVFRFASPEAKEKWRRKSYEQGVGEETWHHGKAIDSKSAAIVQAGLGGANPGLYQAPEGTYRLMNAKTIESQEARDHRNQYLTDKTIDQIAAANAMPGVNEWAAKGRVAQSAANDNAVGAATATPTQPLDNSAAEDKKPPSVKPPVQTHQGAGQMMAGRFGPMKSALESADKQSADDIGRIAVNSILGNYGDEIRAGASAAASWWDGKSFSEAYDSNLQTEREATSAAQERQGLTGTGVELLTSFIPIVGDASGALADFKDWKEHGDDWGWKDYGLVALGLIPEMPNRKAVKGAEKIGEELLETAGKKADEITDLGKKSSNGEQAAKSGSIDHVANLEVAKGKVLSQKEARHLESENRGLIYVQGNLQGSERARAHQSGGVGAFSDIESKKFADPALRFDNPNPRGLNFIRFDSAFAAADNSHTVLVDSKTKLAIWSRETQKKTINTLERAKHAVIQNPGHKVMYEFDSETAAEEALAFIRKHGYSQYIEVGVRKP
jgi:hypothetical protein